MDISETDLDKHYYLNTVKKGKITFSVLDQKRAKKRLGSFKKGVASHIHALEYTSIEGVDFRRCDVNIANKIYGYSKGGAMGRFKHPHIHLDIDILFVNKTAFLLVISWDIGFIHCIPMVSSVTK